jgi:mannose-6-phosphate isomerase-like protein (cupin superfamily)
MRAVYGNTQHGVAYTLRGRGELQIILANGEIALASVSEGDVLTAPAGAKYIIKSTGAASLEFITFRRRHG